jgi:hypothetical protein
MPKALDRHNINARLENQIAALLDDLENGIDITFRDRLMALNVISRLQVNFVALRKEHDQPGDGSAVRKYAKAFATDAPRGKTKDTRARAAAIAAADDDRDDDLE